MASLHPNNIKQQLQFHRVVGGAQQAACLSMQCTGWLERCWEALPVEAVCTLHSLGKVMR